MPRRNDLKSILIIGAGPIVIGQACEFDYSGVQACKALREEGYKVILVNSNPATIMTDPELADSTYIEPINWKALKKIIEIENDGTETIIEEKKPKVRRESVWKRFTASKKTEKEVFICVKAWAATDFKEIHNRQTDVNKDFNVSI